MGKKHTIVTFWYNDDLARKCDERRGLKVTKYLSKESKKAYQGADNNVKAEIKSTKEKWIQGLCDDLQNGFKWKSQPSRFKVFGN